MHACMQSCMLQMQGSLGLDAWWWWSCNEPGHLHQPWPSRQHWHCRPGDRGTEPSAPNLRAAFCAAGGAGGRYKKRLEAPGGEQLRLAARRLHLIPRPHELKCGIQAQRPRPRPKSKFEGECEVEFDLDFDLECQSKVRLEAARLTCTTCTSLPRLCSDSPTTRSCPWRSTAPDRETPELRCDPEASRTAVLLRLFRLFRPFSSSRRGHKSSLARRWPVLDLPSTCRPAALPPIL